MANELQIKGAMYGNGEIVQGSTYADSKTYVNDTLNASIDPFDSKANKYSETDAIMIQAVTKGVWAVFSTDGSVAAVADTDNQHFIGAGESRIFALKSDKKYLRLIEDEASAKSIITELA